MDRRRIECVDSLRISPREENDIIAELAQGSAMPTAQTSKERRLNNRVPYLNEAGLFVQMRHPGGSVVNYLVRTRNLSPTGIAFLHGSFVYNGTACVLALHDRNGKMVGIEGKVVRCKLVRGHVHDVGVRFNRTLDLQQFASEGQIAAAAVAAAAVTTPETSEELPRFNGSVLCAEENASDAELFKFYLESLGVTVTVVSSGLEALDYIERQKFDAIVAAVWLPGMSGTELAEAARGAGFTNPFIALTADDRYEMKVEALARGCTDILTKPYSAESLVRLLSAHLSKAAPSAADVKTLASEMWSNVKMRPLITKFVSRLAAEVKEIERLTSGDQAVPVELLAKLTMGIKGSAGNFGYPTISKTAQRLTDLVLAQGTPAEHLKATAANLVHLSAAATAFLEKEAKAPAPTDPKSEKPSAAKKDKAA
jgi:CheY-like chemotaxis protein